MKLLVLLKHVLVQSIPGSVEVGGFGSISTGDGLFDGFIGKAAAIGSLIAVFLVVKGGIDMATAGGDPGKIKEGKEQVTAALLGLALILLAVFTIKMIANLLKEGGISIPGA